MFNSFINPVRVVVVLFQLHRAVLRLGGLSRSKPAGSGAVGTHLQGSPTPSHQTLPAPAHSSPHHRDCRLASLASGGKRLTGHFVLLESQFPSFLAPTASVRANWACCYTQQTWEELRLGIPFPRGPPDRRSTPKPATKRSRLLSESPKPCPPPAHRPTSVPPSVHVVHFSEKHSSTPLNTALQLFSLLTTALYPFLDALIACCRSLLRTPCDTLLPTPSNHPDALVRDLPLWPL